MGDFEISRWIHYHWGMNGLLAAIAICMTVIFVVLWLYFRLHIPKGEPLCGYCRYKGTIKNRTVYVCQNFTRCGVIQFRKHKCPREET